MTKDIKELANSLRQGSVGGDATARALLQAVEALSGLVKLLLLDKQLGDLTSQVEGLTGAKVTEPETNLSETVENLEEVATSRTVNGGKQFLLHRLTIDNEYENSTDGESNVYETTQTTEWVVEVGVAELDQDRSEATVKGANPVVSCFVPSASITEIKHMQSNTGTWGNLGQNPHKNMATIVVKPGKYEIYRELKQ